MVNIVETRKSYLTLGRRVGVGLGFWIVGVCGVMGGLGAAGSTIETKFDRFGAQMSGDIPRFEAASQLLEKQQRQAGVNLATGAVALLVGGALTRRMEQLWSGPVYGPAEATSTPALQPPAESIPAAVPPETAAAPGAAATEGATILQFPSNRAA
jgi:hypothetical protein